MNFTIRLSELAQQDLIEIEAWVALNADGPTATAYGEHILSRIARLTDFPNRGTPRSEFGPGVRWLSFEGRLILFYRTDADAVVVLRVISAARDIGQITLQ